MTVRSHTVVAPVGTAEPYPRLELATPSPVIAFDIGGTLIKIGIVDASGLVLETRSIPTTIDDPAALILQLVHAVEDARARFPQSAPQAIGVHVPGIVDDDRGVVLNAENLGLKNVPMRDDLERLTGLPVAFGNDARGAGLAEFEMGAARDFHNVVVVAIGTGIGAAVFADGRLYTADGMGCEIGHLRIVPLGSSDGIRCACGGVGCLETIASASSIAKAYHRATGSAGPQPGAEAVFEAARDGDPIAIDVIDAAVDALAFAFASLTTILSPQAIVIAGGLSHAGEQLFAPLRRRLDEALTFQRRPQLLRARFGGQAGVIASALKASRLLAGE